MAEDIIINTDGGARGNPGPGACAFVITVDKGVIYKSSKYLGTTTNNQAEYGGVILALLYLAEKPEEFAGKRIIFVLDSELVARQLSGEYKTKNKDLRNRLEQAKVLEKKIKARVQYTVVSRERNKVADELVNQELDKNSGSFTLLNK